MDLRTKIVTALIALSIASCGLSPMQTAMSGDPTPVTPSPEQGWESSGGSGVVCFAKEADSARAAESLKKNGYLSDEDRRAVQNAYTLDHWDHQFAFGLTHHGTKTADQILSEVDDRFRQWAPLFHQKLGLANSRTRYNAWKDNKTLKLVPDAKPNFGVHDVDSKCHWIQLAVRHSRSRPGYWPEVWIEADRWLIENKLKPVDQAILRFHEPFYLIGREFVHRDSNLLRRAIAFFFSEEIVKSLAYWNKNEEKVRAELRLNSLYRIGHALSDTNAQRLRSGAASLLGDRTVKKIEQEIRKQALPNPELTNSKKNHLPQRVIQAPIGALFGDFFRFFLLDPADRPKKFGAGPSQYTRYQSLVTLILRLRDRTKQCYQREHYENPDDPKVPPAIRKKCYDEGTEIYPILSELTDEEVFIHLNFFFFEWLRHVQNPENLVVWNAEDGDRMEPIQVQEMTSACSATRRMLTLRLTGYAHEMLERGKAYCEKAGY